jgi:hypothetical protein
MSRPNAEEEKYEDQYTAEGGNTNAEPDVILFGPRCAIFGDATVRMQRITIVDALKWGSGCGRVQ